MNTPIPDELMLRRSELPAGRSRMVRGTDTYNEIDDQFAVADAAASEERLSVEAIYAAPFLNERSASPETTAMHLLQSRVDITVIARWLGHEDPATTHLYTACEHPGAAWIGRS